MPTARTIVTASTNSTADARKLERMVTRATEDMAANASGATGSWLSWLGDCRPLSDSPHLGPNHRRAHGAHGCISIEPAEPGAPRHGGTPDVSVAEIGRATTRPVPPARTNATVTGAAGAGP